MENKNLQVRKESVFTRFVNFIRGMFWKKIEQEVPAQLETTENNEIKSNFFDEIRVDREENTKLIDLQRKYENNEIDLAMLSDEEIEELDLLYKRQVADLKEKLDDRKNQLNIMKNRIKSYAENV